MNDEHWHREEDKTCFYDVLKQKICLLVRLARRRTIVQKNVRTTTRSSTTCPARSKAFAWNLNLIVSVFLNPVRSLERQFNKIKVNDYLRILFFWIFPSRLSCQLLLVSWVQQFTTFPSLTQSIRFKQKMTAFHFSDQITFFFEWSI